MDPLVRASLFVRRVARRGYGTVLTAGLGLCVVLGVGSRPASAVTGAALVLWVILLASRIRTKLTQTGDAPFRIDVELGLVLATGLYAALLRFDGGLSGPLSPSVYVLVALVAAFARPLAGLVVVSGVVLLEASIRKITLGESGWDTLTTHVAFIGAFALLNLFFLRAEVARIRMTARARLEEELSRVKDDARRYRLLGAGEAEHQDARSEDRLARSSVEEIHQSVHYALELLRRTLDLHTAVLLWLNDAGTHLRISELSTASDEIHDAPFAAGDGVLGAVFAQRERVSLANLKPSYKVPYYAAACPVRALSAMPIVEGDTLRGVLAIDRVENRPFTAEEEELASQAARYCLRAIHNERVFVQLERAKVEQGKLYRAAQTLGAAMSEKDVLEAGVKAAREIASFDLALVTTYDDATRMHEVCAVSMPDGLQAWSKGEGDEGFFRTWEAEAKVRDLVGARFAHNAGLVSMVVKNRYALPYRGEFDGTKQVVLTRRFPWPKMPSLLVLPLLIHDCVLGTLILGARRRHAFGDAVRPTLEVLTSHLAVSLSNARMVHKLEKMATTDGLTGLYNKRAMLEAGTQQVAASARFNRKLSVLIADIDFFKKVNDTHGHDVGDLVIKGLGEILKRQKRATDVVARFGGEEFVVLCEQTDAEGAMLLAERIREDLEKTVFHVPGGPLSVTCSVGFSTFPEAGRDWEALFKAADEALYVSKRTGRNRSTASDARPEETAEAGRSRRGKRVGGLSG